MCPHNVPSNYEYFKIASRRLTLRRRLTDTNLLSIKPIIQHLSIALIDFFRQVFSSVFAFRKLGSGFFSYNWQNRSLRSRCCLHIKRSNAVEVLNLRIRETQAAARDADTRNNMHSAEPTENWLNCANACTYSQALIYRWHNNVFRWVFRLLLVSIEHRLP